MQSYFWQQCRRRAKFNMATWRQTLETTSPATNSDEEKDESKDPDSELEADEYNEVEEFPPITSQRKTRSKGEGSTAQCLDNHVADMNDVNCSDE